MLKQMYKEDLQIDLDHQFKTVRPTILWFDDKIKPPQFGFKDRSDYYNNASCYNRIPKIKVPTFFLNTLDDPVIGIKCVSFDVFRENPNVALGTTKYGGHLGYHTSIFNFDQWFVKAAVDYFKAFEWNI